MSEQNKKFPTFQLNVDDFLPADEAEKESLVTMRASVGFWKDGFQRLLKNRVAIVSFVVILIVMIFSFIVPSLPPGRASSRTSSAPTTSDATSPCA